MGHYWLEMHLKYIHTLSLKPQKHGQSWTQALRNGGFTKAEDQALLVLIVVIEICEVGIGVGLPREVRVEVLVSFL